jgi:hypothetical protein
MYLWGEIARESRDVRAPAVSRAMEPLEGDKAQKIPQCTNDKDIRTIKII